MKIGRNDSCPCGSGKKYKKCCIGKSESEIKEATFRKLYKDARHNAEFKECLHPDKENCSDRIIKAHTITKSKFLSRISENGIVLMPCPKPDTSPEVMHRLIRTIRWMYRHIFQTFRRGRYPGRQHK